MKRAGVFSFIAVMLVFGMMALGSGSDSGSEKKEIAAGKDTSSDIAGQSAGAAAPVSEEVTDSANVTIEEQVLFEQDGLKVTATEYIADVICCEL